MPEVDGQRITLVGVSLGAPFAAIAGARADYPGVALLHGFGDLPGTIRHQFARRWEPEYGGLGTLAAWLAERAISTLVSLPAPERDAERLDREQKVLWVTASEDEFVPRSAVESMREALRRSQASTREAHTGGSHVRGDDPQAVAELFAMTTVWMQEQGLLDPPQSEATAAARPAERSAGPGSRDSDASCSLSTCRD
jgi:dienelactone hydrolase